MTLYLDDGDVRLYHGDALETVRELPSDRVDCVVTSPPYWGLRCYGVDGQMGLEETPDLFVAGMVELFREIRRVLAPHGTCWVNLGDSYNSAASNQRNELIGGWNAGMGRSSTLAPDLKPKDLVGIPWRVAFALQHDGWWLRSDIIWAKPNPMPESVTDRPTKAHEYVFLLTKQPRYWFDTEAVREPHSTPPDDRRQRSSNGYDPDEHRGRHEYLQKRDGNDRAYPTAGRNVRSVWNIATQPYPEAHFATFPEELARRCILAGCPTRVCRVCGKPSERIVDVSQEKLSGSTGSTHNVNDHNWSDIRERTRKVVATVGWTDCECPADGGGLASSVSGGYGREGDFTSATLPSKWRPGLVLDPFIGSGTTAKVARDHQRHAIGIDLNREYLELAARRLQQLSLLNAP